uniref:Uncharacterized protein n=1 Tax=Peronospora matthiolae TaxID=2874970 RepID=A0AAV1V107_9STRA
MRLLLVFPASRPMDEKLKGFVVSPHATNDISARSS